MVGHRGIEPRNTCVSGRPRRPAGSWPADAAGVEPARPRLARVQAGFRRQVGLRIHERRGRELNSQGLSSAVFETGPVTNRVASPCADGGRIERPRAVQTRPPVSSRAPCHSVNHPYEEGGRLERHEIIIRASLSGRARRACPVHLPYRPGDSDPDHPRSERGASTSWARTA